MSLNQTCVRPSNYDTLRRGSRLLPRPAKLDLVRCRNCFSFCDASEITEDHAETDWDDSCLCTHCDEFAWWSEWVREVRHPNRGNVGAENYDRAYWDFDNSDLSSFSAGKCPTCGSHSEPKIGRDVV